MVQSGLTFDRSASCNATAAVYEFTYEQPVQARPTPRGGLSRRSLERAMVFMESHLGEPIALTEVAAAACLSRAHFARMFRVTTGVSVMSYLTRLRIESAKSRLLEGEPNLAELACALGFCDQSHFCRVFRRAVGMTPGRFARDGIQTPHARAIASSLPTLASMTVDAWI
jgi:AraC family transcriptional regulator